MLRRLLRTGSFRREPRRPEAQHACHCIRAHCSRQSGRKTALR